MTAKIDSGQLSRGEVQEAVAAVYGPLIWFGLPLDAF